MRKKFLLMDKLILSILRNISDLLASTLKNVQNMLFWCFPATSEKWYLSHQNCIFFIFSENLNFLTKKRHMKAKIIFKMQAYISSINKTLFNGLRKWFSHFYLIMAENYPNPEKNPQLFKKSENCRKWQFFKYLWIF